MASGMSERGEAPTPAEGAWVDQNLAEWRSTGHEPFISGRDDHRQTVTCACGWRSFDFPFSDRDLQRLAARDWADHFKEVCPSSVRAMPRPPGAHDLP